MVLRSRRTTYFLALVVVTIIVFTGTYNAGMAIWEDRPQPLYRSLEVVFQSFTTTGYGEDAPWQTPQMNGLVIMMQLAGIGLVLTAIDVFATPWLRDTLTPAAPESVTGLTNHIVICGYTPRTDAFIDELEARDQDYVLIEVNPETARNLHESGYSVIEGDPESTGTLANAHLDVATAVVIDAAEDTGASIALSVRDLRSDIRLLTLVEDAELARYHRAAGADDVLSPRQILGSSLVDQIPTAVTTEAAEGVTLGEDFELIELTVDTESGLAERTFAEAGLRERFGVNVIGAWSGGEFISPVGRDDEIETGMWLLVTGEVAHVESLREATATTVREFSSQRIVLAGFGDSGQAAYDALTQSELRLTVLDIEEKQHVDVVGDARDPEVLEEAQISDADGLLLTVGEDRTAIFSTLLARELNPDLRIIVRANEEQDVEKLYRAGADYVQSLATVSGRMLASTVFEEEEVLTYATKINIVRLPAGGLRGRTLAGEEVRTETGCTVVAVIRNGETITEIDPTSFTFEAEDEVVIVGTDESIARYEQTFTG